MGSFASSARFSDPVAARVSARAHAVAARGVTPGRSGPTGRELAGLSLAIAVAVVAPLFLGIGADVLLHSSPFGVLIGLVLGITAAVVTVFQRFKPYL